MMNYAGHPGYQAAARYYGGYLKTYQPLPVYEPKPNSFSLDAILNQDSLALVDKAVNTALGIAYRVQIYRDAHFSLESRWNELSNELGALTSFTLGYNMNIERRRSMIVKERNETERLILENKLQTWKDINEPLATFLDQFHREKALRLDRGILGEGR